MVPAEPLPILIEGDVRLTRRASPVGTPGEATRVDAARLVATLRAFRREHGFGRAIAAPQVGIDRRLIAIDLGADPFVVLDPEIVWRSGETFEVWDDCLSVPGRLVRVRRDRSISIDYRDLEGRPRRWARLPPDLSELLQHEIDHLDGILMTTRATGAAAVQPIERRTELAGTPPPHRLSLDAIRTAASRIDPIFTGSPQYESEPLSAALGVRLTVKVETQNPLRSFKGRGADWLLTQAVADGERGPITCASAGNFGQAMAYACRRRGIALTVFASRNANPLKVARMRALGADVRIAGDDFDGAKEAARSWAGEAGARFVEDGRDPAISEGSGSIAVELLARGEAFDAVLVPLGNGALLGGVARWIKAVSPATEVIAVAARGAPAMERSFRNGPGGPIVETDAVSTIADGVAVRIPIPEAVHDMHGVVDDVMLVDDATMLEAMALAERHLGLVLEPSGALGLAALLEDRPRFAGRSVATILGGGNPTAVDARPSTP